MYFIYKLQIFIILMCQNVFQNTTSIIVKDYYINDYYSESGMKWNIYVKYLTLQAQIAGKPIHKAKHLFGKLLRIEMFAK